MISLRFIILNVSHTLMIPKGIQFQPQPLPRTPHKHIQQPLVVSFCMMSKASHVQNQRPDLLPLNMFLLHFSLVKGMSKLSVAQVNNLRVIPNSSLSFMPQIQSVDKSCQFYLQNRHFLKRMLKFLNDQNNFSLKGIQSFRSTCKSHQVS